MNRKQQRRVLEQRLHAVRKKRKEINKNLRILEEEKERLRGLINEMQNFGISNKGTEIKMRQVKKGEGQITPPNATGIWIVEKIVEKRDQDAKYAPYVGVQLAKVDELVNSNEGALRLTISLDPKTQMKGSDGKEVTFNIGDLVVCNYEGDMESGKHAFRFANIEPSGEEGQKIYDIALAKIGLKPMPAADNNFLIVDGNARKLTN